MATSYQVDLKFKVPNTTGLKKAQADLDALQRSAQKAQRSADPVADSLRKLQAAGNQASVGTKAATSGIKSMTAAATAFAAKAAILIAAVQSINGAMTATFERSAAEKRLQNLTKSTGEYEAALAVAAKASKEFGVTQTSAQKALGDTYARLSGVGYGLKEVTQIYYGFNKAALESGVAGEEAAGAFLQLSQALGSGVLQGDEFRSISERMPALLDAISASTGVARGQLKAMSSEGKITADVIYQALAKAAQGGVDLEGKITPAQLAMMRFKTASEELSVSIGTQLLPAVAGLAEGLTTIIEKLTTLAQSGFVQTLLTPFKFLHETAVQIGESTSHWFQKQEEVKQVVEGTKTPLDELLDKYSSLPPQVARAKAEQELLKQSTAATAAIQKKSTQALGQQQTAIQQRLSVQQALLGAERSINDAKLQSAQADMQAAATQTEREAAARRIFELTKANADLAYQSTVATAEAEQAKVEAALQHAEVLQQQLEAEIALQRSKQIYNEQQDKALQAVEKMVAESRQAANVQEQITAAVVRGAEATRQKEIEAARVTQQMVNQTNQQEQTNAAIQQGASAMGELANQAQRAASASAGIGGGGGGGGIQGNTSSHNYSAKLYDKYKIVDGQIVETSQEERDAQLLRQKLQQRNEHSKLLQAWSLSTGGEPNAVNNAWAAFQNGGVIGPKGSRTWYEYQNIMRGFAPGYADGGYVTGPQQAIVGEGGEPEYILPESKMSEAMARYASGMRGSSVIPDSANVSINYSGSTVDMGGSSYINKSDVGGIVSQAVNQTLNTIKRSPRARLEAGIR